MTQHKNDLTRIYQQLATWFQEVKSHELTSLVELVEQAKKYLTAAEDLPEEKIKQFVDNLKYDLIQFYQQSKQEAQHSIYLGLLNETLWSELAKITDTTQVEWAELEEDFKHDGIYKAGDMIGFGVLVCQHCQYEVEYTHLSEVIPCPKCQHTTFTRHSLT